MFDAARANVTTRINEIQSQLDSQCKEFDTFQQEAAGC